MISVKAPARQRSAHPFWFVVLTCLVATLSAGADGGPTAGQLDLVSLGFEPVAVPSIDLDIGTAEFAAAALAVQPTDPDLAALLANVSAFSLLQFAPPDAATLGAAQVLPGAIVGAGWVPVQTDTQGTRTVTIHAKFNGLLVSGLTVIAIDPGREVSIANVVGDIQPTQLVSLGLPIPH